MKTAPILLASAVLSTFAVVGVGMVAVTHHLTGEQIQANERAAMLDKVRAIVPAEEMTNDPLQDVIEVSDPELLGSDTTQVYRVRNGGAPVAVILNPIVPDGYAGPIRLLVSVLEDGTVGGVRVLSHRETPGLGDQVEEQKSDWVFDFTGHSLGDPPEERWAVKRDGGVFDQFTGATITPRSIVQAVKNTLVFVRREGVELYQQAVPTPVAEAAEGAS